MSLRRKLTVALVTVGLALTPTLVGTTVQAAPVDQASVIQANVQVANPSQTQKAANWLLDQFSSEGALLAPPWGSDVPEPNYSLTLDGVIGLLAAGATNEQLAKPIEYLAANAQSYVSYQDSAGQTHYSMASVAKFVYLSTKLRAADAVDEATYPIFFRTDFVDMLKQADWSTQAYHGFGEAWAGLALAVNGANLEAGATVDALVKFAWDPESGAFGYGSPFTPDFDSTGIALQALQALPGDTQLPSVGKTVKEVQDSAVNFAVSKDWTVPNTGQEGDHNPWNPVNTAGYLIPALVQAGVSNEQLQKPMQFLLSSQLETGALGNELATAQGLLGLSLTHLSAGSLTLPAPEPAPEPAPAPAPEPAPAQPTQPATPKAPGAKKPSLPKTGV